MSKKRTAIIVLVVTALLPRGEWGHTGAAELEPFNATAAHLPGLNDHLLVTVPISEPPLAVDSLVMVIPGLRAVAPATEIRGRRYYLFETGGGSASSAYTAVERLSRIRNVRLTESGYGDKEEQLYSTDQLLLKFRSEVTVSREAELLDSLALDLERELHWLDGGCLATVTDSIPDPVKLALQIEQLPEIGFCQPNFVRVFKPHGTIPNDSLFSLQWDMNNSGVPVGAAGADTKALHGWEYARGSESIKIAIIDEGVDTTHEDLEAKIVDQYDATDFDDEQQPNSWDGHGTACAGVAAAVADNGQGVAGIARRCSIMPIRIAYKASPLPILWVTTDETIANGIVTAVDRGADVLSISWGLTYSATIIQAAINYAKFEGRDSLGCVIVCSSGNSDNSSILYPAAYSQTIAVGATNEWDERKSKTTQDGETNWGSNYGSQLSVVAPGVHIWTTDIMSTGGYNTTGNPDYGDPSGNYWNKFTGTSAAAPHVAGLAGLILSIDPTLTADSVIAIIKNSADDQVGKPTEDTPGWDQYMGYGRINIGEAVRQLSPVHYVGGVLSENTVWDSSQVVLVESTLTVPNGVTLTIEPGTVVKFDHVPLAEGSYERTKLICEGTIQAVGTEINPVLFTSIRDDSYGGDLNEDGPFTQPSAGDWGYISIKTSASQFRHCVVRYGGAGAFDYTPPALPVYREKQLLLIDGVVSGFIVDSNLLEQFEVVGGAEADPSWGINWVTSSVPYDTAFVANNHFTNGDGGVRIEVNSSDGTARVIGNQMQNLSGTAIEINNPTTPSLVRRNVVDNAAIGIKVNSSAPGLLIDSNRISNVSEAAIEIAHVESHLVDNVLLQTDSTLGAGNGIEFSNSSNISIERNSATGFAAGIKGTSGPSNAVSNAIIQLNTITNNDYGVWLGSTDTAAADGPNVTLNHNDLTLNAGYNLYLGNYRDTGVREIDARNNWWGSVDLGAIANGIFDYDDATGSAHALFTPYRYGSVFSPEGILGLDQAGVNVDLFPDSTATRQLWLYNQSLEWGINYTLGGYPAWLSLSPLSGSIPINDSVVINLDLDASGLIDNLYDASFDIYSSDPLANPRTIPVTLQVSSIFLLQPNGGEIYNSGQTQLADWLAIDTTNIDSVVISFSFDAGNSYTRLLSAAKGIFSQTGWTVPVIATDSAKLKVEAFWAGGLTGIDETDSLFTVLLGPYICGQFNNGYTGNTDCDANGKRNLADLTRLIDRIYLSRTLLCNEAEGNIDGDSAGKLNLSDVTRLIDHIYLSKSLTALCQ